MENATQFSPPDSTVEVVGAKTPEGDYTITVSDRGIGMSAEQLADANALLQSPPPVGLALSRSLGFIVVGRLARRLRVAVRLAASPAGGITAIVDLPLAVLTGDGEAALASPVHPAPNGMAPPPQLVEEPRPLVVDDLAPPPAPTTNGGLFGAPPAPPADQPATLSDAIPAGDDFERGLASLVGPEAAPDEDLSQTFWGDGADAAADDTFADLAAPPAPEDFQPLPPPPPPPAETEGPGWAPAPDWLDGELASVEANMPAPPPPPAPAAEAPTGSAPLTRRTPRATLQDAPAAAAAPEATNGARTASTRRSPEEVRAMLSRYRRGVEDGRQSPGTED
jgi:hypothetical protein